MSSIEMIDCRRIIIVHYIEHAYDVIYVIVYMKVNMILKFYDVT